MADSIEIIHEKFFDTYFEHAIVLIAEMLKYVPKLKGFKKKKMDIT
jgi:hypothetical protein